MGTWREGVGTGELGENEWELGMKGWELGENEWELGMKGWELGERGWELGNWEKMSRNLERRGGNWGTGRK